jgi:hypothetical protein
MLETDTNANAATIIDIKIAFFIFIILLGFYRLFRRCTLEYNRGADISNDLPVTL